MNKPIHISDAEFEEKVLNSELPVIVDFWAPWCGPCKMIAPALEKIAEANDGKLIVAKVNTDENPEWAMHFGVQGSLRCCLSRMETFLIAWLGQLPRR